MGGNGDFVQARGYLHKGVGLVSLKHKVDVGCGTLNQTCYFASLSNIREQPKFVLLVKRSKSRLDSEIFMCKKEIIPRSL